MILCFKWVETQPPPSLYIDYGALLNSVNAKHFPLKVGSTNYPKNPSTVQGIMTIVEIPGIVHSRKLTRIPKMMVLPFWLKHTMQKLWMASLLPFLHWASRSDQRVNHFRNLALRLSNQPAINNWNGHWKRTGSISSFSSFCKDISSSRGRCNIGSCWVWFCGEVQRSDSSKALPWRDAYICNSCWRSCNTSKASPSSRKQ